MSLYRICTTYITKFLGRHFFSFLRHIGESQPLSLDTGVPALDIDKFYFIRESPAIEVYFSDIQGGRHGDRLRQELSLGAGNVPDVAQEEFHSAVQSSNLGKRFPEVVEQFDGVELVFATAAGGNALVVILAKMST